VNPSINDRIINRIPIKRATAMNKRTSATTIPYPINSNYSFQQVLQLTHEISQEVFNNGVEPSAPPEKCLSVLTDFPITSLEAQRSLYSIFLKLTHIEEP